ncbi:MAG: hypothetical protein QXP04_00310 [Candidatus Nanoarchaeia archaeon]|nr:hypothetical protein [Candidatus Jingweiarchaeum tengchongense]
MARRTDVKTIVILLLILFLGAAIFGLLPGVKLEVTKPETGTVITTPTGQMVAVERQMVIAFIDKFGGGGLASKTIKVYTQDSSGNIVLKETLTTDSDGTKTTGLKYLSGQKIWVLAVETANVAQVWVEKTVPYMTKEDAANSAVKHQIVVEGFRYAAPTIKVQTSDGTQIADNGNYNKTASGSNPIFSVIWNTGTDNCGFIESYDPINKVWWKALLVVKFSGANYELITVSGFDGPATRDARPRGSVEKGTAIYYCAEIVPESITRWKVGNSYVYSGSGMFTFSLDLSGYSGDNADMDIYIYYYADWDNFVAKGSLGPNALSVLSGAPHTVNLVD